MKEEIREILDTCPPEKKMDNTPCSNDYTECNECNLQRLVDYISILLSSRDKEWIEAIDKLILSDYTPPLLRVAIASLKSKMEAKNVTENKNI